MDFDLDKVKIDLINLHLLEGLGRAKLKSSKIPEQVQKTFYDLYNYGFVNRKEGGLFRKYYLYSISAKGYQHLNDYRVRIKTVSAALQEFLQEFKKTTLILKKRI